MESNLKSHTQKNGRSLHALAMSEPGHSFDNQHSRIDRFDETFVRAFLIGFDNFIDRIGIDQHQNRTAAGCP